MKSHSLLLAVILFTSLSLNAQVSKSLAKTAITLFTKAEPEYRQLQKELTELEKEKTRLIFMMQQFDKKQENVTARMQKLETQYDSLITLKPGAGQDQLLNATKQMQETQMSFNLQYLQLQSQMQHENRSYTAISNIMKTKHETVKNSISNVR